ncbi:hypothetical protein MAR_005894, partial [Mya arenaria]
CYNLSYRNTAWHDDAGDRATRQHRSIPQYKVLTNANGRRGCWTLNARNALQKLQSRSTCQAISAVRRNVLSQRAAAAQYGVPRSILRDGVGQKKKGTQTGQRRMLTDVEERALVTYLIYMANQCLPHTRDIARYVDESRATLFNMKDGPSDKYFRQMFARHPDITEKRAETLDKARKSMSTQQTIDDFFDLYGQLLDDYDLRDKSEQIFNCDEVDWTGRETFRQKIIGPTAAHTYRQQTMVNQHITAHLCVSASGRMLPPLIIFPGSHPHRHYHDGIPDSCLFGVCESGFINTGLFHQWFIKIFLANCGSVRPVLLIMDNHDAHINLHTIKAAIENDVVLLGLPAHTTHILQPLDVKVIAGDEYWAHGQYCNFGLGKISNSFASCNYQASPASIREAFRLSGLCPINRMAIDRSQLVEPLFAQGVTGTSAETCPTCGAFRVNPLVAQGLIPESLGHILVPPRMPPMQAKRRKSKAVKSARILTGEEMLNELQERELEQKRILVDKEKEKRTWPSKLQKEKEATERKMKSEERKRNAVEKRKREEEAKHIRREEKERKRQRQQDRKTKKQTMRIF